MKTLIVYTPNPTDATSLYRAYGPLYAMRRNMADLHIVEGASFDWRVMKSCDAVMIQRPALDSHVLIANLAKINHKPVWVDYDDDLYCVPFSNPTYRIYGKQKIQNNVTTIIAKADMITVSTPALRDRFIGILNELSRTEKPEPTWVMSPSKIIVVPNAYDDELLTPLVPQARPKRNNLVCWRGSATHAVDLMTYAKPFCEAFGRHLDWTVNLIGEPFWGFIEEVDKIPGLKPTNNIVTESLDPIQYFKFLSTVAPHLMIVPLEDNRFNHAKSNIVWLEGLHAGAVTLAPNWDEWRRPGVINYSDPDDFGKKLDAFMSGKYDADKLWAEGAAFVRENLLLSKVNRIREVMLRTLISASQQRVVL